MNSIRALTPRKVIVFTDRTIDRALTILFLILLLIGIYFIYDSWYVFNASTLDRIPGYEWYGPATLADLPEDAKAWLKIDDTKINCPIMQGDTNSEYLNKNPYGDYSLSGSVFLDSANSPDFSDHYSLLYGHHMSGGYMFGALDMYLDETYFDAHRTGRLWLRDPELDKAAKDAKENKTDNSGTEKSNNNSTEKKQNSLLSIQEDPKTGKPKLIPSWRRERTRAVEDQIAEDDSYGTPIPVKVFAIVETDASVETVFNVRSGGDIDGFIRANARIYREPEGSRIIGLSTCRSPLTTERIVVFATLMDKDN